MRHHILPGQTRLLVFFCGRQETQEERAMRSRERSDRVENAL
jgi:hypothetical protein